MNLSDLIWAAIIFWCLILAIKITRLREKRKNDEDNVYHKYIGPPKGPREDDHQDAA
jgi:hypothetical protein